MNRRQRFSPLSRADEQRLTLGISVSRVGVEQAELFVRLTANLVATNAKPFRDLVDAELAKGGITSITVDCRACPYIDNRGLQALKAIAYVLRAQNGGRLHVEGLNADLVKLFEISHLDRLIDITPSEVPA